MTRGATRMHAVRTLCALLAGDTATPLPDDAAGWANLQQLAAANRLEPALWVELRDAGRAESAPGSALSAVGSSLPVASTAPMLVLQRAYEHNVRRWARLWEAGRATMRYLAAGGIEAIPLKGLHGRCVGIWRDPAARAITDVDVLVRVDEASRSLDALRAAGLTDHPEPIGAEADHHLPMLCRGATTVEVHTELLVSTYAGMLPARDVWTDARVHDTDAGRVLLMSPTHAMTNLIAHGQLQDGTHLRFELPLRALYETHVWIAGGYADAVDWDDVARRFDAAGRLVVLESHLALVADLFGAEVPGIGSSRRSRLHDRAVWVGARAPRLVAPVRSFRNLRRALMPQHMSARYGPGDGRWWLFTARVRYVGHRVVARTTRRG